MDPASGAAVRTGQPVLLRPARIDATSEMLSALVRPFGCVASSSSTAESSPPLDVAAVAAAVELDSAGPFAATACDGASCPEVATFAARAEGRSPQATSREPNAKAINRVAMYTPPINASSAPQLPTPPPSGDGARPALLANAYVTAETCEPSCTPLLSRSLPLRPGWLNAIPAPTAGFASRSPSNRSHPRVSRSDRRRWRTAAFSSSSRQWARPSGSRRRRSRRTNPLGMALGHYADLIAANERDGYFTIGLLATCPSMPGLVAGLQHSGPTREPIKIGMLWLDAHPDFNTPETTRSGSLGGMPVAVATGRALQNMRLDAHLDPPLSDRNIVMGGVRLVDPLEQSLLDASMIEQVSVDDLRTMSPAVFAQLDRLDKLVDKIYVHIDMDVLDPREVMGHGNKVPGGPSSEQLARLFEAIFRRYPKASAIGFATIPATDEGGLSIAALNRMIAGAVRGVQARERKRS